MKSILLSAITVSLLAACGNDPVTNAGYFDDDLDRSIDQSTHDDHSQANTTITNDDHSSVVIDDHSSINHYYTDTVFVVDTVYHESVDTIYKMTVDTLYKTHIDTLYKTLYDTLTTTIIDTVINTLVDTVVQRVIDTVINTMVDTVYTRVVDTVFNVIEATKSEVEIPRDTTLTLYDTSDGTITAKMYNGVVYKNTFYEAKEYPFGMNAVRDRYEAGKFVYSTSTTKMTSVEVRDYSRLLNCSGECYVSGYVYLTALCGVISQPDYNRMAFKNNAIQRFTGWRVFDETDAYDMAPYLNRLVSDSTLVYLTTVSTDPFTANVAKYKVPTIVSNKLDKDKIKYICAYDLQ